jgi:ssDNA-binding Zn-finger/Zn-ribbon topoisomerase 1
MCRTPRAGGGGMSAKPIILDKDEWSPAWNAQERSALRTVIGVLLGGPVLITVAFMYGGPFAGWMRLFAIDYRECPRCRECLDGLPDEGACPRCGRAYIHERLVAAWKATYVIPAMNADPAKAVENKGLILGTRTRDPDMTNAAMWGLICFLAAAVALQLIFRASTRAPWWARVLQAGLYIVMAVTPYLIIRIRSARVIALDFRCCPTCRFDLRGLDSPGRCPECGARFTDRWLHAWWRVRLGVAADEDLAAIKARWLRKHPEQRREPTSDHP